MSEEDRIDATQPTEEPLAAEPADDVGEVVVEETFEEGVMPVGPRLTPQEAIADAQDDRLRSKAAWSLVDRELFAFLFANCLFFAGALSSWTTRIPDHPLRPEDAIGGLDTIRGALILGIAIYGFWTAVFNIWHRQMKIWPYLVNALIAEWAGISLILGSIKGPTWDLSIEALKRKTSPSLMDQVLYRAGVVPPGAWPLVLGGVIVFVVLIRGIMAGSQKVKARAATEESAGDEGSRRRRR